MKRYFSINLFFRGQGEKYIFLKLTINFFSEATIQRVFTYLELKIEFCNTTNGGHFESIEF